MVVKGTLDVIFMARGAFAPIKIKILGDKEVAIKILKENHLVQNITIQANNLTVLFFFFF